MDKIINPVTLYLLPFNQIDILQMFNLVLFGFPGSGKSTAGSLGA